MTYAITYRPDEEEENMLREMKYHRYLPSYQSALSKGIRILYRDYKTDKDSDKLLSQVDEKPTHSPDYGRNSGAMDNY